jgi:heterodisulfide reductase subunit B
MVACPLCHGNLDIRQHKIDEGNEGENYDTPIFYVTQLAALALGVASNSLGFESVITDPKPLLREKQLL